MLRACRGVLRPGGKIAYFNIFIAREASLDERRPFTSEQPELYSRAEQTALLRSAGFVRIRETDVTDEYRRTQAALYDANARHARALGRVRGREVFDDTQRFRLHRLEGIDAGIVRRSLFVAERPVAGLVARRTKNQEPRT